ncbi:MAG TPA: hypothetical protein VE959_26805 [Bryobacteraceae bacterium]|nr:hypothetical protein [Bryobacteraceae bacterium]
MSSRADTLRLRSGSIVNGSFLGGTADDIRFLVNDDVQHYARAEVAEIVFNSDTTPSASPETPKIDMVPDIAGAPFLRGSSGYIPLEREIGMMSRGGGMYGMGATVYRIQGPRSPVRVQQGDRLVFVVRLNAGGDPRQFQLYRLESRMGYRQTQPTMGGTPPALPVTINKIGVSVYEITPARPLYPGEYAVSPMNSNESYCFGVDY